LKDQITRLLGFTEKTLTDEVKQIPLNQIVPSPYQPRTIFDDDKIDELSQTIKTHGLIQPIVVRVRNEKFEIIAGERRFRAAKKLGMETMPGIIRDFNDSQAASIALIENLQREGLTAIEEAIAYQQLIELHELTQESLAQRLGKGQSTIANKLRLLHLPEEAKQYLMLRKITERHARALLVLDNADLQMKILNEIVEKDLNVKQTEFRVKQVIESLNTGKNQKDKPKRFSYSKDVRLALNTIRQSVDMVVSSGMNIVTDETDHDDFYEIVIKIPKKTSN
jgi:ParB family chromosome partitioning protein